MSRAAAGRPVSPVLLPPPPANERFPPVSPLWGTAVRVGALDHEGPVMIRRADAGARRGCDPPPCPSGVWAGAIGGSGARGNAWTRFN